jgi:hypothetical protein
MTLFNITIHLHTAWLANHIRSDFRLLERVKKAPKSDRSCSSNIARGCVGAFQLLPYQMSARKRKPRHEISAVDLYLQSYLYFLVDTARPLCKLLCGNGYPPRPYISPESDIIRPVYAPFRLHVRPLHTKRELYLTSFDVENHTGAVPQPPVFSSPNQATQLD